MVYNSADMAQRKGNWMSIPQIKKKSSDFCFTQYDTQNQLAKLSLGYVDTFVLYIELFLLCESGTQDTGSDGETESLHKWKKMEKISNTIELARVAGGRSRKKTKLIIQLKFPFACQEKVLIKKPTKIKPFDKNLVNDCIWNAVVHINS